MEPLSFACELFSKVTGKISGIFQTSKMEKSPNTNGNSDVGWPERIMAFNVYLAKFM
jgi:hypothetical protein